MRRLRTANPQETEVLGAALARTLSPGDVVLVSGELGAGKTTFVRGACRELGVTEPVTSPTFTIAHRYAGRRPVAHLDLYRLRDLGEEDPGLLDEYVGPDAISFVEWPEHGALALGRPARRVVRLAHLGGDRRSVEIE